MPGKAGHRLLLPEAESRPGVDSGYGMVVIASAGEVAVK